MNNRGKLFNISDQIISMPLLETYAAISLGLALAIPTFFEKVIGPTYRKKVDIFSRALREEALKTFSKAAEDFKRLKTRGELSEKLSEVSASLGEIQTKTNRLDFLDRSKFGLFFGWMASLATSIAAIYVEEVYRPWSGLELYNFPTSVFFVMLMITVAYVYALFRFDRALTKLSEAREMPSIPWTSYGPVREFFPPEKLMTGKVIKALKNNNVPFTQEGKIDRFRFDFVIPNIKNPKFFIEIRHLRYLHAIALDRVLLMSLAVKKKYPDSKTILITNLKDPSEKLTRGYLDKVFDLDELGDFIQFVKMQADQHAKNKM